MTISLPVIDRVEHPPHLVHAIQCEIRELAKLHNAVILAHNYQWPEVQDVADYVGDSLGLSREVTRTDHDVIVFCGVHFMAETAAILSPDRTVLLPDLRAGCSLASTITAEDVRAWRERFPDHVAVGYVNTSAAVKAELDYCCTSGNAVDVIDSIPEARGILFLPDFFLGAHIRRLRPHRRIEIWMGECHVHKDINARSVRARRMEHPGADVLIHPECGCAGQVLYEAGMGDIPSDGLHVTSTEGMVRHVQSSDNSTFIVATEIGILHRMRTVAPDKRFLPADPDAMCSFMKTITLESVRDSLVKQRHVVTVPPDIRDRAWLALNRMVAVG